MDYIAYNYIVELRLTMQLRPTTLPNDANTISTVCQELTVYVILTPALFHRPKLCFRRQSAAYYDHCEVSCFILHLFFFFFFTNWH